MNPEPGNLIDGRPVPARSGRTTPDPDPADPSRILGVYPDSDERDVAAAVAAARRAHDPWRRTPADARAGLLQRCADAIEADAGALARDLTADSGKPGSQAETEVATAAALARASAAAILRFPGIPGGSLRDSETRFVTRDPLGVCAVLTEPEPAFAGPAALVFAALAAGNTVVLKPSLHAPAAASTLVAVLAGAGLPAGAVNLVHGSGGRAGAPLVAHPDVTGVGFRGGPATARTVAGAAAQGLKRTVMLVRHGGDQVVLEDADLDLALESILRDAFDAAGQAAGACKRLILHRRVAETLTGRLVEAARALRIGDGRDEATQIGPLASPGRPAAAADAVARAVREGAIVLCGGGPREVPGQGYFFEPTVLGSAGPDLAAARLDPPGPGLGLVLVDSFEEAIHVLNDRYPGVSSVVHTRDMNRALRAARDAGTARITVNGARAEDPHADGATLVAAFTAGKHVRIDHTGSPTRMTTGDSGL